jgi:hypothetical protein
MSGRFSIRTDSGRRGVLWVALALLLLLLVADLLRGDGSLLRRAAGALDSGPSRQQRLFDRVLGPR